MMETPIPIEASKVTIEVVRTETVKPLTPTPDHLKKFNMTVHDQFAPNIYMPMVFFYPAGGEMCAADRNRRLKESLSETLVRYYPVAGRVDMEGVYVDCDDSGVEFIETKVNGYGLKDILGCPDNEILCKLLPCDRYTGGPRTLLRVQSNVFECGGIAVGTCTLHLATDACGRSAFLKEWTALARGDIEIRSPPPDLDAIASRFPVVPNLGFINSKKKTPVNNSLRRFVFDGAKIASLRDKIETASGVRPTRVEAVTTLIYKCIVNALTMRLGHETRPSFAFQATNLRRMFDPPLSESSLGNMVWFVFAESGDQNEFINDQSSIISQFRKGMRDLTHDCTTKQNDSIGILEMCLEMAKLWRKDRDSYFFSSICGFGLYKLDFGWGKPAWVSMAAPCNSNTVKMMDSREGGGIEAWITLGEEDMSFFETNVDLLEFASLNPPISLS